MPRRKEARTRAEALVAAVTAQAAPLVPNDPEVQRLFAEARERTHEELAYLVLTAQATKAMTYRYECELQARKVRARHKGNPEAARAAVARFWRTRDGEKLAKAGRQWLAMAEATRRPANVSPAATTPEPVETATVAADFTV